MRTTKDIPVTRKETDKLTCDRCNRTDIIYSGEKMGSGEVHVSQFSSSFGYGSDLDQRTIYVDLCDDCLFSILDFDNIKYWITPDDSEDSEYDGAI